MLVSHRIANKATKPSKVLSWQSDESFLYTLLLAVSMLIHENIVLHATGPWYKNGWGPLA